MNLVLSLFPGIGLLDMAFEQEGFCVVRGPDLIWGGDVRSFHPPAGRFDGVIGGPPCQSHSRFRGLVHATGKKTAEDLIPEYERVVALAQPSWFLMENVEDSPEPVVGGYSTHRFVLSNRDLGEEQNRVRAFTFGRRLDALGDLLRGETPDLRKWIEYAPIQNARWSGAILASGGRKPGMERHRGKTKGAWHGWTGGASFAHALEAQGLPADFLARSPFTAKGKFRMVGNGVPLPMGRTIARAVRQALGLPLVSTVEVTNG